MTTEGLTLSVQMDPEALEALHGLLSDLGDYWDDSPDPALLRAAQAVKRTTTNTKALVAIIRRLQTEKAS